MLGHSNNASTARNHRHKCELGRANKRPWGLNATAVRKARGMASGVDGNWRTGTMSSAALGGVYTAGSTGLLVRLTKPADAHIPGHEDWDAVLLQATLFGIIETVPLFREGIDPSARFVGPLDNPAIAAVDRVVSYLVADLLRPLSVSTNRTVWVSVSIVALRSPS